MQLHGVPSGVASIAKSACCVSRLYGGPLGHLCTAPASLATVFLLPSLDQQITPPFLLSNQVAALVYSVVSVLDVSVCLSPPKTETRTVATHIQVAAVFGVDTLVDVMDACCS